MDEKERWERSIMDVVLDMGVGVVEEEEGFGREEQRGNVKRVMYS